MFDQGNYQSETYQNVANMSLMFTMYSPTFGNGNFVVQPAQYAGGVSEGFDTIPYLPLEAMIYQQQASNPASAPVMTLGGSNTGQQVIAGQYTMEDNTGTSRYQMGFQATNAQAG